MTLVAARDTEPTGPYGARVPDTDDLATHTAQLWAEVETAQTTLNRALDARDDAVRAQRAAGASDAQIASGVNTALGAKVATNGNVRQIRNRAPDARRPSTVDELRATRHR